MRLLRETLQRGARDDGSPDAAELARDIEAVAHGACVTREHYADLARRCIRNCAENPACATPDMPLRSDAELTKGTVLARVRESDRVRREIFHNMLREKFEQIEDRDARYKSSLRCHRCKSSDVTWDLKQTRSADEASTAFCVCAKCNHRWTIK